ncbi:MAG: MFS transporter [Bacteroidales bacterium]
MTSIFKKFSRAFWTANTVELLERMAYYAVFIVITLYLSQVMGFSDLEAGVISGLFSGALYLLPTFAGAFADKIGFRKSMLIAFSFLSIGYFGLGLLPTLLESAGLVDYGFETTFTGLRESNMRYAIVPVMAIIIIGGAFIKSIISGTVAKETTSETRARGFSLFYMMVNIGSFTGKTVVEPVRRALGSEGLVYLNYFSAATTLVALFIVFFLYKTTHTAGQGKSFREIGYGLWKVITNAKLIILTLITSGFWMVYMQLYATMPKYVIRMAGADSAPAWYANVNPLVVVLLVNAVTTLMKKRTAITSMGVGMLLMPLSAMVMASGNMIEGNILGLNPIAFMMVVGIAIQALAETFISPRYLEYFSMQAPKGDEGMYLGFSHINSFIASVLGFGLSGLLLAEYCPDPSLYASHSAWKEAAVHAHYIWFYFAAIGLVSAIALFIFGYFTRSKK